jgi:polysaccharide chain length determinant protein (PEP-CTERM system associated)
VPNNTVVDLSERMEQLASVARRRHWWFSITACAVAIAASLGSFLIANRYKSEATILVQQQQIPERYVVPNSTTDLDQALRAMTHDVLSRPRLLQIILKFNLYRKQRKRLSSEQLVELMRSDIAIRALDNQSQGQKTANAFTISYTGSEPNTVQQIASELTALFINEDLATQERRDTTTTNFLEGQLAVAQEDLGRKEQHLRDFKMANLGELPEQREGNLQILSGLQEQLRNTNAALARASEQRAYLESLLAQYQNLSVVSGSSPTATNASPIDVAQGQLNRLQSQRTVLLGTYSPQHPDVQKIDREIAETKLLVARLQENQAIGSHGDSSQSSAGVRATDTAVAQLNSQLKENQLEISNDTSGVEELRQQVAEYQHRLNLTPVREQQLTGILRDYDLAKKNYDDLYAKKTQSALATELQKNKQGEQFRLIEPPNLPGKPFAPNRLEIALGGLAAGIVLGLGLAFLAENRDTSFHSEKQLRERFDLPVSMAIPRFSSTQDLRLSSLKSRLQWCGGAFMLLTVLLVEYYVYRQG